MNTLKIIVFLLCLWPIVWLIYALFDNQLGANPVETLIRSTGLWALRFLWFTLAITPLRWLTGWNKWVQLRRMLGLFVFFYASLHLLLYVGLDQSFDLAEIIRDIIKRPFITIGFFSYVILVLLAITSPHRMVKALGGQRWKKLHQWVYIVAMASILHFYMLIKLDKSEAIFYFILLVLLFIPRIMHYYRIPLPGILKRA